jgi:tetratricopeptide (TPR) repeat protein
MMKKFTYVFLSFLCPLLYLSAAEIGLDTDDSARKSSVIEPQLSPREKSDIEGLSRFGASMFQKKHRDISNSLLAALAENPNSSRILAFLLKNFQDYSVPEDQIKAFIAIAEANPRAIPLNVAALSLVDCIKPAEGSSIDLKRRLAEKCVAANNPDKFDRIQLDLFQSIVKTLSMIYLEEKKYDEGNELFDRILKNKNVFERNIFLQQAVIFYTQAAQEADKSRRLLWLLPSKSSQYAERKQELLKLLHQRSDRTTEMNKLIKHLTFLQKMNLYSEANSLLTEQLAGKPLEPVLQVALAELFSKQGKHALAATIWRKMVRRNPENKFFLLKLAENEFSAGLFRSAAKNYQTILKGVKGESALSMNFMLVLAELQLGNVEAAQQFLSKLPATKRFAEIRAHVLSISGKDKEAFKELSQVISASPKKADSKLCFFWLALAIKNKDIKEQLKCLDFFEKNMDLKDPETANSVGYTYADLNRKLPEAEKLIAHALKSKADSPEYLDSMAWVLFRMNKFKEAAGYIEKAVTASGSYPDAVISDHAGDIFNALGDRKKALHYWNLALKLFSFDLNKENVEKKIKGIAG